MSATKVVLSVPLISNFLATMDLVDRAAFGRDMTPSEWRILLVLGQQADPQKRTVGCSYKSLKCCSVLSDDALSRGLRRLVEFGLIDRENSEADQRVMRYRLSASAQGGMARIGMEILRQMAAFMLALSAPNDNVQETVGNVY